MEKAILQTISYFSLFKYPPTLQEIRSYLPLKCSSNTLKAKLDRLVRKKILIVTKTQNISNYLRKSYYKKTERYTLGGYSMLFSTFVRRQKISTYKMRRIRWFLKLISTFSQIRLIGFSGSIAMLNAKQRDDIDIFIITAKDRLFTGRAIVILLSSILGLRRKRGLSHSPNKICFNLFFDEKALKVPNFKKNRYIAHEILQMMPYVSKRHIYNRFIWSNKWVFDYFPNARDLFAVKKQKRLLQQLQKRYLVGNLVEQAFKQVQLNFITHHRTKEIITDRQLWFFPDDFQMKLKKNHL